MKRTIIAIVLAAIVGSAFTLGTYRLVERDKTIKIEQVAPLPRQNVSIGAGGNGKAVALDFTDVAEKVMPGVVHIKSTLKFPEQNRSFEFRGLPDPFRDFFNDDFDRDFFGPRFGQPSPRGGERQAYRIGTGSGVIMNEKGYIVTNNHVIDDADDIEITLDDNRVFKADVIGTDPATDLALLKIEAENLRSIPLADSDSAKVGEWVLAVGNPFNLNSTVTSGIISAKGRSLNIVDDKSAIESFIQTDAAINQGNSGGALVNLQGWLVGICTAIASPTGSYAGYGFAVPANIVRKVVADLLEHGTVQRGTLGIMITGVNRDLAREKDLDVTSGVYVDSILENSAAREAGVKAGDVILEVDGRKVSTASQLRELIARHNPGDKVRIKVDRAGNENTFEVTLANPNENAGKAKKDLPRILSSLGAEFEEADAKTCKRLNISGGVEVTKLYPGALRMSGMREGFIITAVDGKPVQSVDDLSKKLQSKKGSGVMLEGVYQDAPGTYYYAFGV